MDQLREVQPQVHKELGRMEAQERTLSIHLHLISNRTISNLRRYLNNSSLLASVCHHMAFLTKIRIP